MPFYYIDYCLAQTCALQFKVWMDRDYREAWKNYLKLCRLSARDTFVNMIESCGLKSPFADGTVKELVDALKQK